MKLRYADRAQEPAEGQRAAFYMNDRLYFLTGVVAETDYSVTFAKREVVSDDPVPADEPPPEITDPLTFNVEVVNV